jgi:hypothetical protein
MGEYQHDMAVISGTSSTLTTLDKVAGSAVSFYFGLSPRSEIFNGYVVSVADDQNSQGAGALSFTLHILGATKVMQAGLPRFWTNRTIPSAVEALTHTNLLGFASHEHVHRWQTLAQTEESDWKRACDFAKRIGWAVYNRYGVVMLWNPLTLFTNSGPAATLVANKYQGVDFDEMERTLVEFTPVEDSVPAYQNMGAKVAYFNGPSASGPTVFTQSGDYTLYKFMTDIVIRNTAEATIFAGTHDSLSSEWKQQATARVLGNATLFPGMCVDVSTSNPKYYRDRYNGRWLIRGVQHSLNKQGFQTQLVLARPDSTANVYRGAYVNFWNDLSMPKPTLFLDSTPTPGARLPGDVNLFNPQSVGTDPWNPIVDIPGPDDGSTSTPQWISSWANPNVRSAI